MKKALFLFALIAVMLFSFASGLEITNVELNDRVVREANDNYVRQLTRDNYVDVKVEVESSFDVRNAQIIVEISGLELDSDLAYDETNVFDMKADVRYVKDLQILLSKRMQNNQAYRLRVKLEDGPSQGDYKDYFIYVDSKTRVVEVKDVLMSPENEVVSGQALLVQALIRNYGQRTEEDVYVNVKVPELGVSASAVVSEILADESVLSAPLFLKMPDCATPGVYEIETVVEYKLGDLVTTKTSSFEIVEAQSCKPTLNQNGESQFVAEYQNDDLYDNVVVRNSEDELSRVVLQYSLMGLALFIILIVILFIVKQAKKEAMDDEEFLKELEDKKN